MVLYYDSAHNFNKYSVLNFNKLSSIESKLDTQNKFYKDFIKHKREGERKYLH